MVWRATKPISASRETSGVLIDMSRAAFVMWIAIMSCLVASVSAWAQQQPRIDEVSGRLEPGQIAVYELSGLNSGEVFYAYVEGVSGGLDPLVALLQPGLDIENLEERLAAIDKAAAQGRDPLNVILEVMNDLSLAWNDDIRGVYDAAIEFPVPADGTYQLLVASSMARKIDTTGKYRLLLGVDAPQVLSGKAAPTDRLARLRALPELVRGAEKMRGTLSKRAPFKVYQLGDIDPGDTLYIYVEGSSNDLRPSLTLEDFGAKPIISANIAGKETVATLQYAFEQDTAEWRIRVAGGGMDETLTTGEFRLIAGFNTPEVLEGQAANGIRAVIRRPIPVKMGVEIQQIVSVDQQAENFSVVGDLIMEWRDPRLAYEPDPDRPFKFFTGDSFHRATSEKGILWPQFIVANQQGRRDLDARSVKVYPNGEVSYAEEFTVTLQAPEFDFRSYPFDKQHFFINVDLMLPLWYFVFEEIVGFSQVGEQLGEEEWIVEGVATRVSQSDYASRPVSRFTLGFDASRHLYYYIFRILLPMMIIITVSWVLFFLRDYAKRVDAASANLLLFIAFNFTISNDLPRLGYLTLIDMFLVSTFVVTALVLVLAVYLRRRELDGRIEHVQKVDQYVLMFYPITYLIAAGLVFLFFK